MPHSFCYEVAQRDFLATVTLEFSFLKSLLLFHLTKPSLFEGVVHLGVLVSHLRACLSLWEDGPKIPSYLVWKSALVVRPRFSHQLFTKLFASCRREHVSTLRDHEAVAASSSSLRQPQLVLLCAALVALLQEAQDCSGLSALPFSQFGCALRSSCPVLAPERFQQPFHCHR